MGFLVRAISGLAVSAVSSYNQANNQQQPQHPTSDTRHQRQYTPSGSVVDGPTASSPRSQGQTADVVQPPSGAPPSYTDSVDRNERRLAIGTTGNGDHKVQLNDEFDQESDISDESDLTLSDLVNEDEAAWELDEFAAQDEPPSYEDATNIASEEEMIREIIADQQTHQNTSNAQLPCPVILPQRRPGSHSRGFVRAYAPVLKNVGIDQSTFSKFLYNLHKSSQANPWFSLIMISSTSLSNSPAAVALAVETAMQCSRSSGEMGAGRKTNTFLDHMNDKLFKPAGCFAFIMSYKKEAEAVDDASGFFGIGVANVDVSVNQVVPKYDRQNSIQGVANLTTSLKLFRLTSTKSNSTKNESAPLIFPEIDRSIYGGSGKEKSHLEKASQIVQDYLEQRTQMDSVNEKTLGQDNEQSRYNSGPQNAGIASVLSNAVIEVSDRRSQRWAQRQERSSHRREKLAEKREVRAEKRAERFERRVDRHVQRFQRRYGLSQTGASSEELGKVDSHKSQSGKEAEISGSRRRGRRHNRARGVRDRPDRPHNSDVLYLVIVNLPTDRELADARAMLEGE